MRALVAVVLLCCVPACRNTDKAPAKEAVGARVKKTRKPASSVDRASLHRRCESQRCSSEQECVRYPVGGARNAYTCEIRCSGGRLCPEGMDCRAIGEHELEVCFWEGEATVEGRAVSKVAPDPLMARMTRRRAAELLRAVETLSTEAGRAEALRSLCATTDTCASPGCREALAGCAGANCELAAGACGTKEQAGPQVEATVEAGLAAALTRAHAFLGPEEQARLDAARGRLALPAK